MEHSSDNANSSPPNEVENENHFDVILVGTGLTQSILSSAFSKLRKKVLHLDKNDFYGEEYTTVNLRTFMEKDKLSPPCSEQLPDTSLALTESCEEIKRQFLDKYPRSEWLVSSSTETSSDFIRVDHTPLSSSDAPSIRKFNRKSDHPATCGYLMERLTEAPHTAASSTMAHSIHPSFYGYRIDHEPTLARCLYNNREFNIDMSPKLLLSAGPFVDCIVSSGTHNYLEFSPIDSVCYITSTGSGPLKVEQVPCSKADIFNSKLFGPVEKRSLMKLIQFAVDYGQQSKGIAVETLNENELAKGRSLSRPQNKDAQPLSSSGTKDCGSMLFSEYMSSTGVPPRLQSIVLHALCLNAGDGKLIAGDAFKAIYMHVNAAGRFGSTAFLSPIYGTSELPQGFCRMSAVWGGVFMLGRHITQYLTQADDRSVVQVKGVQLDDGAIMTCDHLIVGSSHRSMFRAATGEGAPAPAAATQYVARRYSVCSRPVFKSQSRALVVIPPRTVGIGNSCAIYAIQLDNSCRACPDGMCMLYLSTIIEEPPQAAGIMQAAINLLISLSQTCNDIAGFEEVYFSTFVRNISLDSDAFHDVPSNVYFCEKDDDELIYMHKSVSDAESIFRSIYPGAEFMAHIPAEGSSATEEAAAELDEISKALLLADEN